VVTIQPPILISSRGDTLPRFSLVVATFGRTDELGHLLASLTKQSFSDYEVIVVDQNSDDRVSEILSQYSDSVPCNHVACSPGASKARNLGFAMAKGEIVAFPDDDCWYTPNLLADVDRWFQENPEYSIFAVGAVDEEGVSSGNRWIQNKCDLHPINIFRTTFCSSLFIRNNTRSREAFFDETIGPGARTMFACGDETDFILQLMDMGLRGRFDRTWKIGHPRRDMLSSSISRERAISYGRGMGRVLRKHSLFSLWIALMTYDFLRGLVVAVRGRTSAASLCFAHCRGVLGGFSASRPLEMQLKEEVNL
jgi:glycosyltransferase involved in cell wall biosynthesis